MKCLQNHEAGADLLVEYLEGTLDSARRAELDAHAVQCADCRELLAVRATLDETLAAESTFEISPDFDTRLYARIAREGTQPQSWWQRWIPGRLFASPAWSAAALAAAALAIGLLLHEPVTKPDQAAPQIAVPPADGPLKQASLDREIEQLEKELEDLELLMPLKAANNSI